MILGMDWFSRHQVVVDCRMKRVTLKTPNDNEVIFIDERSNHLSNVISAATARKMVRKGCEAYLAYVIDTVKARPSCGPCIFCYYVFPTKKARLVFLFKKTIFRKRFGVATYFCFYFKRENKIRKKNP